MGGETNYGSMACYIIYIRNNEWLDLSCRGKLREKVISRAPREVSLNPNFEALLKGIMQGIKYKLMCSIGKVRGGSIFVRTLWELNKVIVSFLPAFKFQRDLFFHN